MGPQGYPGEPGEPGVTGATGATGPTGPAFECIHNYAYTIDHNAIPSNPENNIVVMDQATQEVVEVIALPPGEIGTPVGLAYNPFTDELYAAYRGTATMLGSVFIVNLQSGLLQAITSPTTDDNPTSVAYNEALNQIVVGTARGFLTYDATSQELIENIQTGTNVNTVVVDDILGKSFGITTGGTWIYVTDGSSYEQISLPGQIVNLAIDPTRHRLYALSADSVVRVIDTTTNAFIDAFPVSGPIIFSSRLGIDTSLDILYILSDSLGSQYLSSYRASSGVPLAFNELNALLTPISLSVDAQTGQLVFFDAALNQSVSYQGHADGSVSLLGNTALRASSNFVFAEVNTCPQGPTGPQGEAGATGPTGPGMGCAMPSYTFVANENTITIIDPLTHETSVVQAPFPISNLAADPELRKLYIISADGQFAVWDEPTRTFTVLESLPGANSIAVNRNNHKVFVSSQAAGLVSVFNGYTGQRLAQIAIDSPGDIIINPETNIAYVSTPNGLQLLNTNSGSIIGSVESDGVLAGMTVNYCANKIFAINTSTGSDIAVIDAKCNVVCAQIAVPEGVRAMVVNPRLSLLYVVTADGSSVLVYDACTYERVGQLELPYSAQINGISIDLPNHLLYLTDAAGASFVFVLDGGTNEQTGAMPGVVNTGGVVTMACNPPCNHNPCCGREPVVPPQPPPPPIGEFFLHANTTVAPAGSTVDLYIYYHPYYGAYGESDSYFMGDYTDFREIESLSSSSQHNKFNALAPRYNQLPAYDTENQPLAQSRCQFVWSITHQTDPSTHLNTTENVLMNSLHIGANETGPVTVRVTCPENDRIAESSIFIIQPEPDLFLSSCMLARGDTTIFYRIDQDQNPVFATYSIFGPSVEGTSIISINEEVGVFGLQVAENDFRQRLLLAMHVEQDRVYVFDLPVGDFSVQADTSTAPPNSSVHFTALLNDSTTDATWEILSSHAPDTQVYTSQGWQNTLNIAANETASEITVRATMIMPDNVHCANIPYVDLTINVQEQGELLLTAIPNPAMLGDIVTIIADMQNGNAANLEWSIVSPHGEETFLSAYGGYSNLYIGPSESATYIIVRASLPGNNNFNEITIYVEQNDIYPNEIQIIAMPPSGNLGANVDLYAIADQGDLSDLQWTLSGVYDEDTVLVFPTGQQNDLLISPGEPAQTIYVDWLLNTPLRTLSGTIAIPVLHSPDPSAQLPDALPEPMRIKHQPQHQATPPTRPHKTSASCGCAKPSAQPESRVNHPNPYMFISDGGSVYYYNK